MDSPPGKMWLDSAGLDPEAAHAIIGSDIEGQHERRPQSSSRHLHERFTIAHTTLQVEHAHPQMLSIQREHR